MEETIRRRGDPADSQDLLHSEGSYPKNSIERRFLKYVYQRVYETPPYMVYSEKIYVKSIIGEIIRECVVIDLFRIRESRKAGLPPGTPLHVGERKVGAVRLRAMSYDRDTFREKEGITVTEALRELERPETTWIDVVGIHDEGVLSEIGEAQGLHPLTIEDIMNTNQRPKVEEYDGLVFIVMHMLFVPDGEEKIVREQVSLVLMKGKVISFQEQDGDVFEKIRDRIRKGAGKVRSARADYLAYALVDAMVDAYFLVLEYIGDRLEELEDEVLSGENREILGELHDMRRRIIELRRSVWPFREVIHRLVESPPPLITPDTVVYLRDVFDHTIRVVEMTESVRDVLSSILDLHLSIVSNRMNEVMKVLTIIATIFIPLTFVAGVYGMNFKNMPELGWKYGYPAVLILMLIMFGMMVKWFKKKGWF